MLEVPFFHCVGTLGLERGSTLIEHHLGILLYLLVHVLSEVIDVGDVFKNVACRVLGLIRRNGGMASDRIHVVVTVIVDERQRIFRTVTSRRIDGVAMNLLPVVHDVVVYVAFCEESAVVAAEVAVGERRGGGHHSLYTV